MHYSEWPFWTTRCWHVVRLHAVRCAHAPRVFYRRKSVAVMLCWLIRVFHICKQEVAHCAQAMEAREPAGHDDQKAAAQLLLRANRAGVADGPTGQVPLALKPPQQANDAAAADGTAATAGTGGIPAAQVDRREEWAACELKNSKNLIYLCGRVSPIQQSFI